MTSNAIILGAGAAGLMHALSLRAHGVQIAGVFDPDGARARALAELTQARVLESWEEAIASDASVVSICGPPVVHAEQAVAVARVGRRVLVEKPVALSSAELAQMVALPGCFAVMQWRLGRAIRAVRAAIARNVFGKAPTVSIDLAWQRDEAYFAAGRGSREAWGAGALLSIGVHAVDAVLFALDDHVVSSSGAFGTSSRSDLDASAALWMRTERGALISLRLALDAPDDRTRMVFVGAGVSAEIAGTETDPTASRVVWGAQSARARKQLALQEEFACGWLDGPLLVPLVQRALSTCPPRYDGRVTAPTIAEVAPAHRAIFDLQTA